LGILNEDLSAFILLSMDWGNLNITSTKACLGAFAQVAKCACCLSVSKYPSIIMAPTAMHVIGIEVGGAKQ